MKKTKKKTTKAWGFLSDLEGITGKISFTIIRKPRSKRGFTPVTITYYV